MSTSRTSAPAPVRYGWARTGDINAFFGLMLDNVAVLIILFTSVTSANPERDRRFTPEFVLTHMIPGTALGVLIGDFVYTWMAFRLARRTGRSDITAMPLGLDTPSTFGVALLILNPTLETAMSRGLSHQAAMVYAWQVGAIALIFIGVFKSLLAPLGNTVRRWVPRAGLLGSLAAIALALIAFWPLAAEVAAAPLVGLPALAVILVTLVAHRPLPGKIPGALAAVLVGVAAYQLCLHLGHLLDVALVPPHQPIPHVPWQPPSLLAALSGGEVWSAALEKLPIALPFALATIVGGIDCTESAAAAGDEYDTRTVLLTEGLASVAAGLCGGVIQNTPYIGHPAYKAMGGRAAYTLATALFIGVAAYFGWFAHLFDWLPKAAMFPILIYVGLEITSQSFRATPSRHYPALALAALPALAYLVGLPLKIPTMRADTLNAEAAFALQTLTSLANGFILTSLLWGAALAALIDGGYRRAAAYLAVAGVLALFGIIHSPLRDTVIDFPWNIVAQVQGLDANARVAAMLHTPYHWAGTYAIIAIFFIVLGYFGEGKGAEERPPGEGPALAGPAVEIPSEADDPTEKVMLVETRVRGGV
ncbi:MAG TPA: hypothetical protein VEL76_31225 [Gemmataceae bacterium]|nr:hypothetical protein [Gemmataceae bacterium]